MKEFMMIFRFEKMEAGTAPTAEQTQAVLIQWKNWISEIAKQGKYSGTNRLLPEGKTIRQGKIISDGPYMEVKEMIGGYLIVKANSIDEAMEMAKGCPNLTYGGNVEVRAVMNIEYDAAAENFLEQKG
jgi:hypothetical protein